jgi:hypothetical protein
LDILEVFLEECLGLNFLRLDGGTPVVERQARRRCVCDSHVDVTRVSHVSVWLCRA